MLIRGTLQELVYIMFFSCSDFDVDKLAARIEDEVARKKGLVGLVLI